MPIKLYFYIHNYCMDIDLNLNNYTIGDLERFFGVDPNYTIHEVEKKEKELNTRLQLITINENSKKEIFSFLNRAKEKLLNKSEIIPKQIDPFVYANPSDYFKGTINPLEKRLIQRLVCIDTLFRSNYPHTKSTDFTYEFPEYINNVVSMQIKSIEIPYAWYEFSKYKQNTSFKINNTVIEIDDGNYTILELIDAINIKLSNITLTQNPITFTSTFTGDTPFTLEFESGAFTSLGWALGFRTNKYIDTNTYTSESTLGTAGDHYLFVDVDDFHSNHITDAVISVVKYNNASSYIGNNIMARISIKSDVNTLITNDRDCCILKKRDYFGPVKLEKMNLRILNKFGEVIHLNKNDYSIVFEITQLYS